MFIQYKLCDYNKVCLKIQIGLFYILWFVKMYFECAGKIKTIFKNFLGQVIGNASEGKYNTVNNSSSGEVTFQAAWIRGLPYFLSKYSN